eukprot:g15891.t1
MLRAAARAGALVATLCLWLCPCSSDRHVVRSAAVRGDAAVQASRAGPVILHEPIEAEQHMSGADAPLAGGGEDTREEARLSGWKGAIIVESGGELRAESPALRPVDGAPAPASGTTTNLAASKEALGVHPATTNAAAAGGGGGAGGCMGGSPTGGSINSKRRWPLLQRLIAWWPLRNGSIPAGNEGKAGEDALSTRKERRLHLRANGGGGGEIGHGQRGSLRGFAGNTPPAYPAVVHGGGGSAVGAAAHLSSRDVAGAAGGRAGVSRALLMDCPEGYFGEACSECASGFEETEDEFGVTICEPVSSTCTVGNGVRAVLLIALTALVVIFALDALWTGKSPDRRVAQIWRRTPCRGGSSVSSSSYGTGGARAEASSDGGSWGRGGLGRFFQGCLVFVVTGQIITQGSQVLELEYPAAMQRVVVLLQWTNLDPQSIAGSCALPKWPFFQRVNGVVALLTACLASLFVSYLLAVLCGRSAEPRTGADGFRRKGPQRGAGGGQPQQNGPVSSTKAERGSGVGVGIGGRPSHDHACGGAWERWAYWSSAERHSCAAVVVCLLLYPVLCTTLLRVLDCWEVEGTGSSWLRADTSVECSSGQHQTYQMIAAGFLGLYGLGLPLSLAAMVLWARGGDADADYDPSEDADDDDDDDDTTVAVRRIQGGALLQDGSDRIPGSRDRMDPAGSNNSDRGDFAGERRLSGAKGASFSLRGGGGGRRTDEQIDANLDAAAVTSSPTLSGEDGEDDSATAAGAAAAGARINTSSTGDGPASAAAAAAAGLRRGGRGQQHPSGGDGGGTEATVVAVVGGGCCGRLGKSKTWRASGRWVLAVRKGMSSKPDSLEAPDGNSRWRSTIAVWSPYRATRQWFAAWELGRRLLLTGLLTAVSPDRPGEQYLRVAVACVLSGVALVVGEMARPHKDPWIRWIYRGGGVVILLMNLAGLVQKAGAASVDSPTVIILASALMCILILMIVFVCGGWRLSCAEQGSSAAGAAAIIPRGAGPVFPSVVPPRDNRGNHGGCIPPDEGTVSTAAAAAGRKSKAPPRRLWSSDRHMMTCANDVSRGGGGGGSGRDFAKDFGGKYSGKDAPEGRRPDERARSDTAGRSDRGGGGGVRTSGDRALARRLPSYQELVGYSRSDGGIAAASTSKHHRDPSVDTSVEMMNPMFNSGGGLEDSAAGTEGGGGGGWSDRISDGAGGGGGRRQRRNFDRYMLSRSPRKSGGPAGFNSGSGGGAGSAGAGGGARAVVGSSVFSSVSGSGSVSIKSSIDAHLTSSGGRFYSNSEVAAAIPEGAIAGRTPADVDASGVGGSGGRTSSGSSEDDGLPGVTGAGVVGPRPRSRTVELSSNGSGGSSSSAKTAAPADTATSAAAPPLGASYQSATAAHATRAPVLAPGAPTIDGHARRFGGNKKLERSSSSFASTSFESGTTGGNRKRRSDQARVMANWRRSTGTHGHGFAQGQSRSRTISRMSSSGGDGSVLLGPPSGGGGAAGTGGDGKGRGLQLFSRNSSDASGGSFLSQGSGSVGSWVSPTTRGPGPPPNLRYLRASRSRSQSSSQMDFEAPGFGAFPATAEGPGGRPMIVGDSSNLGSNWVPTQRARGGWPLELPARSAMPRWWIKYASRSGDSSQSDLAAGAPPDLVLAAAERAKAAEREAAAARVEAVFGDENHRNERRFSNADGGSNIVDFRAFVRAGGSGTSSFDSRASESGRRGGRTSTVDEEEGSDASASSGGNNGWDKRNRVGNTGGRRWGSGGDGRKPTVRSRSSSSGGSAGATPLSSLGSAELKKHLEFDFEDEGELEEDPVSFVRVSERVSKINAKVVGRAGFRSSSPMPWMASQGPP